MPSKRLILLGTFLLGCAPAAASAHGWLGMGYSAGWAAWWPAPSAYTQQDVPYFAKHPPVYYSRPVARPYGLLPYPYLPVASKPQPVEVRVVVHNHFAAEEGWQRPAEGSRPEPRRIVNPFAQAAEEPVAVPDEIPLLEPEG